MVSHALLRLAWCGLSPGRGRRLLADMGSAEAVLAAIACGEAKASRRARQVAGADDDLPAILRSLGVSAVALGDAHYPPHLAALPDAPIVLFVRGTIPALPAVAVVGTRSCSGYGRRLAHQFGRAVAEAGWVLVSGLARGVDGHAHRGTVAGGGRGVAVLGSGIDVIYPPEHAGLANGLVASGGALVTEYPPGARPEGWRFPPRNRIISGLASAVVVVEAAATGGALITAALGAEQGREVFAVPGDVHRRASEGCNRLIRDGAHPVLGPEDLVAALELVLGPPPQRPLVAPRPDDPVLAALDGGPLALVDLVEAVGGAADRLLAHVARLEAAGRVCRDGDVISAAT